MHLLPNMTLCCEHILCFLVSMSDLKAALKTKLNSKDGNATGCSVIASVEDTIDLQKRHYDSLRGKKGRFQRQQTTEDGDGYPHATSETVKGRSATGQGSTSAKSQLVQNKLPLQWSPACPHTFSRS